MPIRTKLTTKGFEEYLERIARAGRDINAITGRALAAGGDVLVEGMREQAPKDTHNLEANIQRTEPEQDGNFVFVMVGLPYDRDLVDAETARYGIAQEFGTSSMAAQPYIRPTIDKDMGKAKKAMRAVYEAEEIL
jgi:HK97 gp10 family phage protein